MAAIDGSQSAVLSSNAEPTVSSRAHSIIAALTNIPEQHVEFVDDNVVASTVELGPDNE